LKHFINVNQQCAAGDDGVDPHERADEQASRPSFIVVARLGDIDG
jgi:hypothetical protein